jgi:sec-independent protein translocase protein TatA
MISTPLLAIALPFLGGIGAPELIIILVIVLILFGPKRLPELGKSLGKTMKAIRDGVDGKDKDAAASDASETKADTSEAKKDAGDEGKTTPTSN